MRIAFYAPLKPPDHPVPSGDRQMARQLMDALHCAGHDVILASRFSSFEPTGQPDAQQRLREEGRRAADQALHALRHGEAPGLWFTYHPYYKAPDWVGVHVAESLGIPYVTCEASYARKREQGPFAEAQAQVRRGLALATVNFCFTRGDREGLEPIVRPGSLVDLPPFIDVRHLPPPDRPRTPESPARLLAVAMMRSRDKLDSYRALAKSLFLIKELPFTLTIVGDGPERNVVEALFSFLGQRVAMTGQIASETMAEVYREADLYVWPGCGEAYGLAYLEAQAMGLPVVAQSIRGVPSVVADGVTGTLTRAGDDEGYARAIATLIEDGRKRAAMGAAAQEFVRGSRTLQQAAAVIAEALP
ncbi:glycosyltransferase family 4 protein [Rhodoligotrophos defluvii]|uniref:glycosyltransferase family 4 protein n=1 Tax=Rhodoligotrophos defluvii TaxID=2561934 RepID=UPI0010C99977|nr:glycosyltransferase family 4 protein [Rhodoligotrophos defluvii]